KMQLATYCPTHKRKRYVVLANRKPVSKIWVISAAEQSVQWTVGILRHFRAFSTPEQNLGLGVLSTPAPPPLPITAVVKGPKNK
ncbi:MAG: hypothetical protein MUO77_01510, partial [Anaerolineales bacterium]|nr:hypothetical protein [Anaerolineales bacterium]